MNKQTLIDQLQESKRWNEFVIWYDNQGYSIDIEGEWVCDQPFQRFIGGFIYLHPNFQLGVLLQFIEANGDSYQHYFSGLCQVSRTKGMGFFETDPLFNAPQEMILYYFNN